MRKELQDAFTAGELIQAAINAEKIAGLLFCRFARQFNHEPKVMAYWQERATEEDDHAHVLEEILAQLSPAQLNAAIDLPEAADFRRLLTTLANDQLPSIVTLEDAIQLARRLERSEVNIVFRFITRRYLQDRELQAKVRADIRQHVREVNHPPPPLDTRRNRLRILAQE